jgi:hypothetical protein
MSLMNEQIEQLGGLLLVAAGVMTFLALAALVYLFCLWLGLHKDRPVKWPEVARDGAGRPLRERK